jgi:hypothetical protein
MVEPPTDMSTAQTILAPSAGPHFFRGERVVQVIDGMLVPVSKIDLVSSYRAMCQERCVKFVSCKCDAELITQSIAFDPLVSGARIFELPVTFTRALKLSSMSLCTN